MAQRVQRPRASSRPPARTSRRPPAPPDPAPARRPRGAGGWPVDLAIMLGAFVLGTVAAELLGAANLGTALGVGQITFALAVVYVLLRR